MAITYLIATNAAAPATLESLGITACSVSYKANGTDSLSWVQSADWLAVAGWAHGAKVALIRRDSEADPQDRCVFVGTVEAAPRKAQGGGPQSISYTAMGPSLQLQLCEYSQRWKYSTEGGVATDIYEPTVVLGENDSGTRLTSGQAIAHAAAYAIARGVEIEIGTITTGVSVPIDERDNIKVWDVVVAMLRYTPDYVLWWDYNYQVAGAYIPALHVTAPGDMATVTKALTQAEAEEAEFVPRYDIRVPGVLITYRWTGEYDGRTVKRRSTDSAGDTTSPRRVSIVYDLEGSRTTFLTQQVTTRTYPEDQWAEDAKPFLSGMIPWLATLAAEDWSIVEWGSDGTHSYTRMLVDGAVPSWTGKHTERETWTVRVAYQVKSAGSTNVLEAGTKDLTFSTTSTDASTKTYRRVSEYMAGETAPAGLAAALLGSWNRLHYDGDVTLHAQDAGFDVLPGMLLRCTGGMAEWSSMDAVVQDVTIDVGRGKTIVRTGTCGRLEADNLMAIYRAVRGRRYSYRRLGRDTADSSSAAQVDGSTGTPNDRVADGAPDCEHQRFAVEAQDIDETLHRIDLHPACTAFADPLHAAAQTLQPREVRVIIDDSGTLKSQLAQVLCGEPYGDAEEIGGGGSGPAGTVTGQILHWNHTAGAWVVSTVGALSSGDLLKWDGSKYVKVTPVTATPITALQYNKTNHRFEVKTQVVTCLVKAAESGWTTITDGTLVPFPSGA